MIVNVYSEIEIKLNVIEIKWMNGKNYEILNVYKFNMKGKKL